MTHGTALEGLRLGNLGAVICCEHFLEFCVRTGEIKGFFGLEMPLGTQAALAPPSASLLSPTSISSQHPTSCFHSIHTIPRTGAAPWDEGQGLCLAASTPPPAPAPGGTDAPEGSGGLGRGDSPRHPPAQPLNPGVGSGFNPRSAAPGCIAMGDAGLGTGRRTPLSSLCAAFCSPLP